MHFNFCCFSYSIFELLHAILIFSSNYTKEKYNKTFFFSACPMTMFLVALCLVFPFASRPLLNYIYLPNQNFFFFSNN